MIIINLVGIRKPRQESTTGFPQAATVQQAGDASDKWSSTAAEAQWRGAKVARRGGCWKQRSRGSLVGMPGHTRFLIPSILLLLKTNRILQFYSFLVFVSLVFNHESCLRRIHLTYTVFLHYIQHYRYAIYVLQYL